MAKVGAAVAASLQAHHGRLMAALMARGIGFAEAEEAVQEAGIAALTHWGRAGVPDRPEGWLMRVAFRKAIDALRRATRAGQGATALALLARDEGEVDQPHAIADERLRLIFTCCHPALEAKSRIALTLRVVCGLPTEVVAAAFLDQPATMGQRISRAKTRIAATGIPFAIPPAEEFPARLEAVLAVVYLIFNAGYSAGPVAGADLAAEGLYLIRLLDALSPQTPEIEGALALMLQAQARRAARLDAQGATVPPEHQDRTLWDQQMLAEAQTVLERAMARGRLGPNQMKAAIALCHILPQRPDWPRIAALYDRLLQMEPTPVVALNRAVAWMESGHLTEAAQEIAALAEALQDYQPFHAASAALAERQGDAATARTAYEQAILRATCPSDARFLTRKRDDLC